MADNVAITPGSGATVSTEEITTLNGGAVSAQHGQRVILATRTADATAVDVVPGQAMMANSLPVAIASNQSAIPVTDNSGTLSVDDGGASLTVDGPLTDAQLRATAVPVSLASVPSHAVTNAGTFAVQESGAALTALQLLDNCISGNEAQVDIVAALPAGTNNIGDVDILSIAAGDNNIGNVDVVSLPASTNTIEVVGDVAHDAAAAGNPLRIGGYAVNVIPAAVANADAANIITDLHGRQIIISFAPPEKWERYTSPSDITDTADDEVFAAVSGVKHYITHFSAMNADADTDTWVYLKDGSTVIYSGYCVKAGGGFVATFNPPLAATTNTAVNVANATTGATTRVNVSGYQAP